MGSPLNQTAPADEVRGEATEPLPVSVDDRFTKLFEDHFDMVWRTIRRLGVSPEAIDDAAQEVFIVASRKLDTIEVGKEKAFLYGTTIRVASTARRSHGRRLRIADEQHDLGDTARPDELLDQKRARALLDEIVSALPDDLRDVFVLFELEGLTMIEIAGCLDVPSGTVASRLRRARTVFEAAVTRLDATNKRRTS